MSPFYRGYILTLKLQLNSLAIKEIHVFECNCRWEQGGSKYPVILYLFIMFHLKAMKNTCMHAAKPTPWDQSVSSLADKAQVQQPDVVDSKLAPLHYWPPSSWMSALDIWTIATNGHLQREEKWLHSTWSGSLNCPLSWHEDLLVEAALQFLGREIHIFQSQHTISDSVKSIVLQKELEGRIGGGWEQGMVWREGKKGNKRRVILILLEFFPLVFSSVILPPQIQLWPVRFTGSDPSPVFIFVMRGIFHIPLCSES